jgi:hypothetical protein
LGRAGGDQEGLSLWRATARDRRLNRNQCKDQS